MPNVIIPTDHPDAGAPLLLVAANALVAMGARVEIAVGGENLVQRLPPPAGTPQSGPTALVCAEGLPNLLHELVHAVQAGCLDDDYGIDYSAIPFDLASVAGRAMLWNELACCTISCAYLTRHGRAARANQGAAAVRAEVEAWFREQVEIQPVFYGMEEDPCAFEATVVACLHEHAAEADAHRLATYRKTELALRAAGAAPSLAAAPVMLDPRTLLQRGGAHVDHASAPSDAASSVGLR